MTVPVAQAVFHSTLAGAAKQPNGTPDMMDPAANTFG
jgi:hypothetical protein